MKKNCKTLLFLFCFTLVAGITHAQAKFGIKIGGNASTLLGFEKFYNLDLSEANQINTSMMFRYHAGLSLDVSVGKLFLRPELEFVEQGVAAKYKSENEQTDASNYKMHYLKLPVHIGYKHVLNMDTDLRFGIGGYASYYLGGDKSFENLKVKKLDYGLSVIAALDYVRTSTSLSYEYGLEDIVGADSWSTFKKENKLPSIRNTCLKLSVAYYF